ncbi:hypothetical protein Tco_1042432 [Tanacetum coccineum]|uniref:Uncharacterized protein n=1 Tax=Tanacetum coccineum TaxID=301880 RepID=A0ABQ5GJ18_9ASTR
MYIMTSRPRTLIPTRPEIPIVLDIPTDLPTTPKLPPVSPFLCSDDSESEQANELPERHVSFGSFSPMVSRWRAKVISRPSSPSRSSLPDTVVPSAEIPVAPIPPAPSTEIVTASPACDIPTPVISASSVVRSRIRTTAKKRTLGLLPVLTSARSVARRKARRAALSLETSSSDTLSSSSSDSAAHTLKSSFATSLQGIQFPPKDHSHHSSKTARSSSGPLTRKRQQGSDYDTPYLLHFLDPLVRAGTSVMHSDESSDEGSPETHTESDMDSDIQADIEDETTMAVAMVDGLGIEPDTKMVEMSFEPGLVVVESKSEPKEAEANDEVNAEIQPEDTIEIEVDVATGIDRIEDIKAGQTNLQAKSLIADGKRSSLLGRVAALEGSNTSLRDALDVERARADSLQRRLGNVEDELRKIRVIGLARRFKKTESMFRISNCPLNSQVKFATCTLLDGALPRNEIQKMVPEENDKIERFIWGLPNNIQGNVTSSKPVRLQDAIRMANGLMDKKVRVYVARSAEQKRKFDNNP